MTSAAAAVLQLSKRCNTPFSGKVAERPFKGWDWLCYSRKGQKGAELAEEQKDLVEK